MISKKNFFFFLFLALTLHISAQNINGFEIYVSKQTMTSLDFHSEITNYLWEKKNDVPYSVIVGSKSIYLSNKDNISDIKEPYILFVLEGGRKHMFKIIFKKDYIDYSDREKDFHDLKQLDKLIKDFNSKHSTQNSQTNSTGDNKTEDAQEQRENTDAVKLADNNFYKLLEEADNYRKNQQLKEAEAELEKALQLKPDHSYALAQLSEVKKLIENEAAGQYTDLITKADADFRLHKFDESLELYNEALTVKPDDQYAASQIVLAKKNAESTKVEQQAQQNELLFNSYVSTGDKAIHDKSYDIASIAYNEALKLKPNDANTRVKLNSIHQKIEADSMEAEHQEFENLFNSFVSAGNNASREKSYAEAKMAYIEALKLKPNDADLKSKLTSVNQQLYNSFLHTGDTALKQKLYNQAINSYNEALKIKTNDPIIIARLNSVEKQKVLDEKNEQFTNYLNAAEKAFNEKLYKTAQIAFNEALKIKPGDADIKTKLNLVSKKIIEDSLQAREQKDADLYATFINTGNKALEKKSYDEAELAYKEAIKLKPGDAFVKLKLDSINQYRYADFVDLGNKALQQKQYDAAQNAYNEALNLHINDSNVKTNLKLIEAGKLQDASDESYKNRVSAGDKAWSEKSYEVARIAYTEAIKIKPDETGARIKLNTVNQKIASDSAEVQNKKTKKLYDHFVTTANAALEKKDYSEAKISFNEALKLIPGDAFIISQIKKTDSLLSQQAIAKNESTSQNTNQGNIKNSEQTDTDTGVQKEVTNLSNKNPVEVKAVSEIEDNMTLIKAHFFKMGSEVGATDESPLHIVKIDSFYLSKYEVTQSQWLGIMGNNPSEFKNCGDCPVENVSWNDAVKFIEKLNSLTGKHFRLPTEAEWEFAAGTQSRKEKIENIAWYNDNSKSKTHPVGELKPDFLGVYDMFGNVNEWCSDWYSASAYVRASTNNPQGPAAGKEKVIRGGAWYDMEGAFRISYRQKATPDKSNKKTGFRVALDIGD